MDNVRIVLSRMHIAQHSTILLGGVLFHTMKGGRIEVVVWCVCYVLLNCFTIVIGI